MIIWLKFFHIAAVSLWFTGLFLLPRLFIAHATGERPDGRALAPLGRTLYFGVMTPAAVVAISLGLVLVARDPHGAWLAAKLVLVAAAVLLHAYSGMLLADLSHGHSRHGPFLYRVLNWTPLPLVLAIAALSAAKPFGLP